MCLFLCCPYSREEIPWEKLPHYVRFNRSAEGNLRVGDVAPNPLVHLVGDPLGAPLRCLSECLRLSLAPYSQDEAAMGVQVEIPRPKHTVLICGSVT